MILFCLVACEFKNDPKLVTSKKVPKEVVAEKNIIDKEKVTSNSSLSPEEIAAVLTSKLLTRDSGKDVDVNFLQNCVHKRTNNFVEFICDDILWPYYLGQLDQKGEYYLVIEDGLSVENRIVVKNEESGMKIIDHNLDEILDHAQIVNWMGQKFPEKEFSVDYLKRSAQSYYRIRLPREIGGHLKVLSGPYYEEKYSYESIGFVSWSNGKFQLVQ